MYHMNRVFVKKWHTKRHTSWGLDQVLLFLGRRQRKSKLLTCSDSPRRPCLLAEECESHFGLKTRSGKSQRLRLARHGTRLEGEDEKVFAGNLLSLLVVSPRPAQRRL